VEVLRLARHAGDGQGPSAAERADVAPVQVAKQRRIDSGRGRDRGEGKTEGQQTADRHFGCATSGGGGYANVRPWPRECCVAIGRGSERANGGERKGEGRRTKRAKGGERKGRRAKEEGRREQPRKWRSAAMTSASVPSPFILRPSPFCPAPLRYTFVI